MSGSEGVVDGELGDLLRRAEEGEHEPPVLEGGVRSEPHPALQPLLCLRRCPGGAGCRRRRAARIGSRARGVPYSRPGGAGNAGARARPAPRRAEQDRPGSGPGPADRRSPTTGHRVPEPPRTPRTGCRGHAGQLLVRLGVEAGSVSPVGRSSSRGSGAGPECVRVHRRWPNELRKLRTNLPTPARVQAAAGRDPAHAPAGAARRWRGPPGAPRARAS